MRVKVGLATEAQKWWQGREEGQQEPGCAISHKVPVMYIPAGHSTRACAWAQVGPSFSVDAA